MAEQRSEAQELGHEERVERELVRERRREREEERRVSRAIGFADFMAFLMVVATGFSAFATWRTATITSLVFATADRPFMGIAKLEFEDTGSQKPYVAIQYKNFGKIPAVDGIVSVNAWLDGKVAPDPIADAMNVTETGSIPPEVDHFFYRYFTPDSYQDIASGKTHLQIEWRIV
ncbi:MAG TPA: hypothetical protein VMH37_06500, partial [Candidatus Binataceae bacterium]|nr:hypothetical protein [Candidatus Binataceae bacterium]